MSDIELINQCSRYTLREEDVYIFPITLCSNLIYEDFEKISEDSLEKLSKMFIGKIGIIGNDITAKIFKTYIVKNGNWHYLKASAYIIKYKYDEEIIKETMSKLKNKEISIGCSFEKITCSICGKNNCNDHKKSNIYNGETCYSILENPKEVFEWAIIAQPTKNKRSKNMKIYKQHELLLDGYGIENNQIKSIDIEVIGHYGNITCLQVDCLGLSMFKIYNNTNSLGHLLKFFIEFFDLSEEDGIKLSKIKNIPCRLIFNKDGECVGFGHFMKNKFVLTKEFMDILNEDD